MQEDKTTLEDVMFSFLKMSQDEQYSQCIYYKHLVNSLFEAVQRQGYAKSKCSLLRERVESLEELDKGTFEMIERFLDHVTERDFFECLKILPSISVH